MIKKFIADWKEWFGNDHIRVGKKYYIKALSCAWWIVRSVEVLLICFGLYLFYILMWVALG